MKTWPCTHVLVLHLILISASDTLYKGQILRDEDGHTLVSSGQKFELGFFSPGSSQNRYLGIWFKNIQTTTVVWVANRESPLTNTTSGALTLDPKSGNLLLLDGTLTVWSTNASRSLENPVARLLDVGNLVVREAEDNYSAWQSFDHITDTLIAGTDFGMKLSTGDRQSRRLSSWKSDSDPAPGDYTMSMDTTGYLQVVIRKGDGLQNRVGPFNGDHFSGSFIFRQQTNTSAFVMNGSAAYYKWFDTNSSTLTRFTLTSNGVALITTWVGQRKEWVDIYKLPADICDDYKACGAYGICGNVNIPNCGCLDRFVPRDEGSWGMSDYSGGCVRRRSLNCSDDVFFKYSRIKMPDAEFTRNNASLNLEECKAECLRNCSCTAYSNLDIRNGGSGCQMWFGDLVDIRELNGEKQVIYIRMAASELGSKWTRRAKLIAIFTSLAGLLLLGLLSLALFVKKLYKDRKLMRKGETPEDQELELPMFDLSTIAKATDDFSINNKLGEGGFGPVYKGILEDGQKIAVKRLSATSSQGLGEFKNEVICIAKLQHRNLVKLLGWCIEGEEKLLIYEYMSNKSLDLILFGDEASRLLDWPKRFDIINGIARGLLYLHQDSCLRVIHRDLKASNILLDDELNPKISDFGMAKIFGGNVTEGNTKRVVGTYGYMSPEYAVEGIFSIKSDVYSFGVLVLEIVSGHANRRFQHSDHHHNLVGHAWLLCKENRPMDLIHGLNIGKSAYSSELLRSIRVALLCVQQRPKDRPSMSSVVLMLGSGGDLPEAKEPGFFVERHGLGNDISSNECTITQIKGR